MSATMKAAVLHGREDVRIEQVDVPRLGPGDVLLRTQVALTCGTDLKVYKRGYHARMITPPSVFGHEVAGIVEEVGPGTEGVAAGAAVVVANSAPCGECTYCRHDSPSLCDDLLFWNGAYAEFARIPARVVQHNLVPLEEGVGFREAAMVEPLACVVRGVEESWIGRGQSVAVIGAGPIGLMFVALARLRGAWGATRAASRERASSAPRRRSWPSRPGTSPRSCGGAATGTGWTWSSRPWDCPRRARPRSGPSARAVS
jgi:L-iditol 2-dehydrogenase